MDTSNKKELGLPDDISYPVCFIHINITQSTSHNVDQSYNIGVSENNYPYTPTMHQWDMQNRCDQNYIFKNMTLATRVWKNDSINYLMITMHVL